MERFNVLGTEIAYYKKNDKDYNLIDGYVKS
jgi:hypothetical protein